MAFFKYFCIDDLINIDIIMIPWYCSYDGCSKRRESARSPKLDCLNSISRFYNRESSPVRRMCAPIRHEPQSALSDTH